MEIIYLEDDKKDFLLLEEIIQKELPEAKLKQYRYLIDFLNSNEPYDVIITDLGLPDAYGPEVLKRIREVTGKPIIVLSGVGGHDMPDKIQEVVQGLGATIFLSKHKQGFEKIPQALSQFI